MTTETQSSIEEMERILQDLYDTFDDLIDHYSTSLELMDNILKQNVSDTILNPIVSHKGECVVCYEEMNNCYKCKVCKHTTCLQCVQKIICRQRFRCPYCRSV